MPRLHLVRHGRATGGWDVDPDPGLDPLGVEQADRLVERLAPLGPLPVVTSPLRRCRETAAPLAHAMEHHARRRGGRGRDPVAVRAWRWASGWRGCGRR